MGMFYCRRHEEARAWAASCEKQWELNRRRNVEWCSRVTWKVTLKNENTTTMNQARPWKLKWAPPPPPVALFTLHVQSSSSTLSQGATGKFDALFFALHRISLCCCDVMLKVDELQNRFNRDRPASLQPPRTPVVVKSSKNKKFAAKPSPRSQIPRSLSNQVLPIPVTPKTTKTLSR